MTSGGLESLAILVFFSLLYYGFIKGIVYWTSLNNFNASAFGCFIPLVWFHCSQAPQTVGQPCSRVCRPVRGQSCSVSPRAKGPSTDCP